MYFFASTCLILTLNSMVHSDLDGEKTQICVKEGTEELLKNEDSWITRNRITFQELIQGNAFADKSLLIKEVIAPHSSQRKLILAPHKWGKSLALDMVEFFARVNTDINGNELPKENTTAYRYFINGEIVGADGKIEKLQQPPLISKEEKFVQKHFANYAVIKFNFDGISIGGIKPNFTKFWESLRQKIGDVYKPYKYLLKKVTTVVRNVDQKYEPDDVFRAEFEYQEFRMYLNFMSSKDDLPRSISFLCQLLKKYLSRDVIILIDDYDLVFNELYFNPRTNMQNKNAIQDILDYLNTFIQETFVSNTDYYKGLITGIQEVPKYISISKATVYNFLTGRHDLTSYYGFTESEVRRFLDLRGVTNVSYETITNYYGHRSLDHPVKLHFSPWSIMNFLHTQYLADYWCKVAPFSKNLLNVLTNFEIKLAFEQLLNLNSYISIDKAFADFRPKNVAGLVQTRPEEDFYAREVKAILAWLCSLGYLSPSRNHSDDFKVKKIYNVSISNVQVQDFIGYHLKMHYRRLFNQDFYFLKNAAYGIKKYLDSDKRYVEKFDINIEQLLAHNSSVKWFKREFIAKEEMDIVNHWEYTHIKEAAARSLMRKAFSLLQIEKKITVDMAYGNTKLEKNFYENKFFAYHENRSMIVYLMGTAVFIPDMLCIAVNSTVLIKEKMRAFDIVKYVGIVVNRKGFVNIGSTIKNKTELRKLISCKN